MEFLHQIHFLYVASIFSYTNVCIYFTHLASKPKKCYFGHYTYYSANFTNQCIRSLNPQRSSLLPTFGRDLTDPWLPGRSCDCKWYIVTIK